MMDYAVFTCRRTHELLLLARQKDFAAWAPVIVVQRITITISPVTKAKRTGSSSRAVLAMPGYIFVPFDDWLNFLHWAPKRFGVAVHRVSSGNAQAKKETYELHKVPARVDMVQLKEMERVCRLACTSKTGLNTEGQTLPRLNVGDVVAIAGHPFMVEGSMATVARCKPTGFVRVFLHNHDKYVDISRAYLKIAPEH